MKRPHRGKDMGAVPIIALAVACLAAGHYLPIAYTRQRAAARNRAYMARLVADAKTPDGYGPLIVPKGKDRPAWLSGDELVARHLPQGLSERKASGVTTWNHPFRLRADHPHYAA